MFLKKLIKTWMEIELKWVKIKTEIISDGVEDNHLPLALRSGNLNEIFEGL